MNLKIRDKRCSSIDEDEEYQHSARPHKQAITCAARIVDTSYFDENNAPFSNKHKCGVVLYLSNVSIAMHLDDS